MNFIKYDNNRSIQLFKNVLASFFIKGWSALVVLMMVPITLSCLGEYQNGVWLTISSILVWIDQMDIGLGNGLRNRLTIHIAHGNTKEARQIVSSTIAMLICIIFPIMILSILFIWNTDIYSFLNVIPERIPELRVAFLCAVILVCITFVLKIIGNVYMGMQLPAVSNFLLAMGQTIALILTVILYHTGNGSFLLIVIANCISPLLVYLIAYPYTFHYKYPELSPSIRLINLNSALELGNLGVKFFWLQMAGLVQFLTANILISQFFSPASVTPYQIAYRYVSIVMVAFSIICMPFWNATTDAYEQQDTEWIRKANQKMNWMTLGIAALLIIMTIVSPWVYKFWIGEDCHIPFGMTVMMALYIFLIVQSMRYSYFLNGIGALRLQLYMTIMTFIFIPMAWIVSTTTHNILWFMATMSFCITPSIIVNMIQFNKIIHNKAEGIWKV